MPDALFQDLRYAIRALRSSPGFAAVAIFSLALGIGANTVIFSLIDSVLLKSLPVRHPEELVQITNVHEDEFHEPDLGAAAGPAGRFRRFSRSAGIDIISPRAGKFVLWRAAG